MVHHSTESLSISDHLYSDRKSPDKWILNHVLEPAYNSGVVTPYNAFANAVNSATELVNGSKALPKLELVAREKEAKTCSPEWFAENASSGLAAVVPYLLAGKAAGFSLYRLGNAASLESGLAQVCASKTTHAVVGAMAFDGFRDVQKGETRLGNVLSGATAFGIFYAGNPLIKDLSPSLRVASRFALGATAAGSALTVGELASKGELPEASKLYSAALSGGFMFTALAPAQHYIGRAIDKAEAKITGSTPLQNFVQEHNLNATASGDPRSKVLDMFSKELPLMRVGTRPGVSGKNTVAMDQELLTRLKSTSPAELEAARNEAARYVGDQIAAKYRQRHGVSEATLTNTGIEAAIRQGRLGIMVPDEKGVERAVMPSPENIGNNALDIHLGPEVIKVPKSVSPADLQKVPPKDLIAQWPVEHMGPKGITLQPGEFILGITTERVVLPAGPDPKWNGNLPLLGEINSKSSIARVGLPIHQTAPVLNNGTNNRITLEIVNVNPTPLTLHPGMKIGSIVFRPLSGYPEGSAQPSHFSGQATPNGLKADVPKLDTGRPLQNDASPGTKRPTLTSLDFFGDKGRFDGELAPERRER